MESSEATIIQPDYRGNGIVNLMAFLLAALGGRGGDYCILRELPIEQWAVSQNILLLVIDGLGYRYLMNQGAESFLSRHIQGKLTSVFPSTTASAITTFLTGLAPQQHGLTGWFTYFKELGSVIAVLPFVPRLGGSSLKASGIDPAALLVTPSVFQRIEAPSFVISPQRIVDSDFNAFYAAQAERRGYQHLDEMYRSIASVLDADGRKYIYAYYPELDTLAHEHGIESSQVSGEFARLDRAFEAFMENIRGSDTTVIVTADHGFTELHPDKLIRLEDHPELAETLLLPLCGEPRVAYCYVRPGKTERFESYVRTVLKDRASLHRSEQLLQAGFFGLGNPHPRLRERIGDYALIMKEHCAIKDRLLGEESHPPIGVHGGISRDEMEVPLIMVHA